MKSGILSILVVVFVAAFAVHHLADVVVAYLGGSL